MPLLLLLCLWSCTSFVVPTITARSTTAFNFRLFLRKQVSVEACPTLKWKADWCTLKDNSGNLSWPHGSTPIEIAASHSLAARWPEKKNYCLPLVFVNIYIYIYIEMSLDFFYYFIIAFLYSISLIVVITSGFAICHCVVSSFLCDNLYRSV